MLEQPEQTRRFERHRIGAINAVIGALHNARLGDGDAAVEPGRETVVLDLRERRQRLDDARGIVADRIPGKQLHGAGQQNRRKHQIAQQFQHPDTNP